MRCWCNWATIIAIETGLASSDALVVSSTSHKRHLPTRREANARNSAEHLWTSHWCYCTAPTVPFEEEAGINLRTMGTDPALSTSLRGSISLELGLTALRVVQLLGGDELDAFPQISTRLCVRNECSSRVEMHHALGAATVEGGVPLEQISDGKDEQIREEVISIP